MIGHKAGIASLRRVDEYQAMTPTIRLDHAIISLVGTTNVLLTYAMPGHQPLTLAPPRWSLDGREVLGAVDAWQAGAARELPNGCHEQAWSVPATAWS